MRIVDYQPVKTAKKVRGRSSFMFLFCILNTIFLIGEKLDSFQDARAIIAADIHNIYIQGWAAIVLQRTNFLDKRENLLILNAKS